MQFNRKSPSRSNSPTRGNRGGFCTLLCYMIFFALSALLVTTVDFTQLASLDKADKAPRKKGKIKQVTVLGERNSGTRWTYGHLSKCFNHTIPVTRTLTRYKHWFQEPVYNRYPHDTLVVMQFRNPYDWLKAMQRVPHHSPAHVQYRDHDKWKKFLTTPWTMERIGLDRWDNHTEPCQQNFKWKDLISCPVYPIPKEEITDHTYSNHQPFYEMRNDGSGKPYDNIMEMRTDKIRNFMTIKDYEGVADVWLTQYEYLLTKGTKKLIDQVAKETGIKPKCEPYEGQNRRSRVVEAEMAEFIRDNLNWTVESWIGYKPHK
mmetsp:Transcript_3859/g.8850  ORF Transcript_3859/g.8850 Transcript_3859/m.8850 type:complete len:317 (-) Transcript_3859:7847-8797(-)